MFIDYKEYMDLSRETRHDVYGTKDHLRQQCPSHQGVDISRQSL